jgi:drug/metabolite transporter (DMT)-like permease
MFKKLSWSSGYPQVLLSGIGFGFLGFFLKIGIANHMQVGEVLTYRFVTAAVLLWLWILFFNRKLIHLERRQILYSLMLGCFGYTIFATFYFASIQGLSIAIAAMLLFTFPIFVNLIEFFILKQHMNKWQWLSLLLAMIGMVVLLWGYFEVKYTSSIFLGLGAAISYSIYVVVSAKVQKNVTPLSSSLYVITAAALTLILLNQPDVSRLQEFGTTHWLVIFGLAGISTIAPLTLFLAGLQKLSGSKASVMVMIEPITAAFAGYFLLNDDLRWTQVLGTLIILAALVLNAQKAKSTR